MRTEIPYIHTIRCIACIMVVMLHTLPNFTIYGDDLLYKNLVYIFTKPCVPLFFMLTGILLLPIKDDYITFLKKRIPKVFLPLMTWGIIYKVMNYNLGYTDDIKEIFSFPINSGGILWYLYILIGIYLFIPFLSNNIYNSKKQIQYFIILWIFSSFSTLINKYLPNAFGVNLWEHNFNLFIYFSGYLGFLFLGYYLHNYTKQIKTSTTLVLYIIIFSTIYFLHFYLKKLDFQFTSIDNILQTSILFILLKQLFTNIKYKKIFSFVKYISKYTFAIYLCHMIVYYTVTINIYQYSTKWYIQTVTFIITFIISLLISVIIKKTPFSKYIIGL